MQQVRRIRFLIIAIACAVLLSIAAFSVSFAFWNPANENAAAKVDGESGLFYVEYPQYITEDGVSAPPLANGKYYIQVPRRDTPISDYYLLIDHNYTEKKLESLYLYEGDTVAVYNGTTPEDISKHNGGESTCGDGPTNNLTLSGGKYTVHSEGFYDFFYVFGDRSFWVNYIGKPAGNTETPTVVTPERDTSKSSVKVKFTDATVVFEMGTAINGGNTYFYIVNGNGDGTDKPGLKMSTGADVVYTAGQNIKDCNTAELGFSYANVDQIILYTDDSDYDSNANKHTGAGDLFYKTYFDKQLQPNYTYTINTNGNVHWDNFSYGDSFSESRLRQYIDSVTGTPADGSSGDNPADSRTKVEPACHGATVFGTLKPNTEVKTVRVMDAKMQSKTVDGVTAYEYHNYICVSRPNVDGVSDDNSIAFLEFKIEGKNGADLSTIPVSSITLTRRDTDEFGKPLSGNIDPAPRVYNYDLSNPVYLSDIGHGDIHAEFDDVDSQGKNTANMIPHYDDGMYVILYFADRKQQYFALDLSIETTMPAEFTLTASVNNTNSWDRYKEGFGEEWGYYLGGLINSVWMWNPTRTTKFTASNGTVVYDQTTELNALGLRAVKTADATETAPEQFKLYDKNSDTEWNDIADRADRIKKFNNGELGNFKYCIVDYSDVNGTDENGYPMWARYTKEEVDVTLTINLTAGSKVKLCMLDWSGERGDLGNEDISKRIQRPTTYFLPENIHASPKNLFEEQGYYYDNDLNFVVPKSGEYSFRYVGYITNENGKFMRMSDGAVVDKYADGTISIPYYNFVIDTLYISKAEIVGEMITVNFDAAGGTFADGVPTKQLVRFGNMVDFARGKAPLEKDITSPDPSKVFGGWYYIDSEGNAVDYDGDPVLDDMTLYVKWIGQEYKITFDLDGGYWQTNEPADNSNTVTTGPDGHIAAADIPVAAKDGFEFVCWVDVDGNEITQAELGTISFGKDTALKATWEKPNYKITFHYNYDDAPDGGVYATQATEPTDPTLTGHDFGGWYKEASCTTPYTDFSQNLTGNIDLYAKWTGASYSINSIMYAFDKASGTHGGDTEDESYTYIDTRNGEFSAGTLIIKVYYDGKALTDFEEDNQRVDHTANSDTYTIADAADDSCYGAFKIGAHRFQNSGSTSFGNYVNIEFYGGDIIDQLDQEVVVNNKVAIPDKGGWYVVGQPTGWKFYETTRMTATNVEGVFSITLKYVLPRGEYKIVYVPDTVGESVTWYGNGGSSVGSAANMIIGDSKTFYVDEFKKGTSGMFPSDIDFRRVLFSQYDIINNQAMMSRRPKIKINDGTEYNMIEIRKDTSTSSTVFYYDVTTISLTSIEVKFTSPNSVNNTWKSDKITGSILTNGYSYMIEPDYLDHWDWWDLTWSPTVKRYDGTGYATTV